MGGILNYMISKEMLQEAISRKLSTRQIAIETGYSQTTIRYWLVKYELETVKAQKGNKRTWNEADLRQAAVGAVTRSEILERLGKRASGSVYTTLNNMALLYGVKLPANTGPGRQGKFKRSTVVEIFVEDSKAGRNVLLKHMLDSFNIEYKCVKCDNDGHWMGEEITLEIDHVNGNHRDNRIENLRLLCPNCHSQTETFNRHKSKP